MSEVEVFPSQNKKKEKMQKRFTVNKLSKKHWFIISAICASFYIGWFFIIRWSGSKPGAAIGLVFGVLATSVLSVFLSLFLWRKVGKWTIKKLVVETLKQHKDFNDSRMLGEEESSEKKKKYTIRRKLIAILFGINIDDGVLYYVEEGNYNADISSVRYILKEKMFDLIAACLGAGFLIAAFAKIFVVEIYVGVLAGSIVILLSPILASWILPVIWTLRDSRIKYMTPRMNNYELSQRIRRSILSRFLGFSGLIAGIGFLYDIFAEIKPRNHPILHFLMAIAALLVIIILLAGTASLVTMIYLSRFHEKKVNDLRDELSEFLPHGITNVMFTKASFI
ncbi:MAG: hypothetical protein HGN29_01835 [Asgard group archaeon]|nr:hypothetical protein [Asgard group archaeon]